MIPRPAAGPPDLEAAVEAVTASLLAAFPDELFETLLLHIDRRVGRSLLFRAVSPARRVIAKAVADAAPARRLLARQARLQRRAARALRGDAEARVPQVLHLDGPVLLMAEAPGRTLAAGLEAAPEQATEALRRAGRWIGAYHAVSLTPAPFDGAAEALWLERLLAGGPLADRLPEAARALRAAQGLPMAQAVTHRDLHPGNLILAPSGMVWGLDFENERPDIALRDLLSLLMEAMARLDAPPEPLAAALLEGWRGRAAAETDPRVALAFQRHQALAALARLPVGGQGRRWRWLAHLADLDRPLFG